MNSPVLPSARRPLEPWSPPLDSRALHELLVKVQQWEPFDADALLDDVGEVLDDVAPPADELAELASRLGRHLAQLIHIGAGTSADESDEQANRLVRRARQLRNGVLPDEYRQAVGHLRRTAWTVNELAERLAVLGCLKAVAA
ncbi:DUF6415 family natural product biosynthesis protein [Streptomyces phaeoluteigriseus]|uniref:DUF6415 family natural product biosynthesis protein n=1 Tax=Streptomyces phaeoluteigriseus TaxID=114686 RepID=A0ABY4ZBZ5_9ACTN|nr:DUF6415 family natural product biosynthesis protein [Streptomyces phaeoluteigriseus]USQ85842.1 DUF6415 family natural product biosynthesis protein [Streptomyces phaeoluteigriseus]